MSKQERLIEWAKELNVTPDALEEEYNTVLSEQKSKFPDKSEEELEVPVMAEIQRKRKRARDLIQLKGVITGKNLPIDIIKRPRDKATAVFDENPDLAVSQGLTDRDGKALWTKDTFSNMTEKDKRIGTPLPKSILLQKFYGISRTSEGTKGFIIFTRGDQAKEVDSVEVNVGLDAKLLDRTPKESLILRLNVSEYTEFINLPDQVDIPALMKESNKFCPLADLESRVTDSRDDGDRLVFTEGWMSRPLIPGYVKDDGKEVSARLVIDHPDRGFTDKAGQRRYGVTCWLPKNIAVDFAEGSRLWITGLVSQSRGREDIPPSAALNVLGIYADPDYKVPIETSG